MTDTNAMEAQRTKTVEEWFGLFGALGFLGGIALLGYQAFLWLKEGQWTPMPISVALGKMNIDYYAVVDISWTGAQKIFIWLLDLPLSLGVVVFGGLLGVLIGNLVHELSMFKIGS